MTDQRCDVGRDLVLDDSVQVLSNALPRPLAIDPPCEPAELVCLLFRSALVVDWCDRESILPEHLGCDPLSDFRCQKRILEQLEIGVGMGVDNPG